MAETDTIRGNACAAPKRGPRLGWAITGAIPALLLSVASVAGAHEPLIGLGPHTLFRGGYSVAVAYDQVENSGGTRVVTTTLGMTYGLTEEVNLSAALPFVRRETNRDVRGMGDAILQVKWRLWKRLAPRVVDAVALVGTLKLPSGDDDLTTGDSGYVLGLTAAREHLRYYIFATARYASFDAGLDQKLGEREGDLLLEVSTGARLRIRKDATGKARGLVGGSVRLRAEVVRLGDGFVLDLESLEPVS